MITEAGIVFELVGVPWEDADPCSYCIFSPEECSNAYMPCGTGHYWRIKDDQDNG